ncbi:MAG: thiamine diphosphokinase [Candidatus Delongbacteria bacterium]|nr:thiamine diphosphokinase [Candidatus Delongbacteria bacterium]
METVALILAGTPPQAGVLEELRQRRVDLHQGWLVPVQALVAADGAGECCLQADLLPDILTGDFDSISPATLANFRKRTTVRKHMDQDCSDLAKGLQEIKLLQAQHVTILGYRGGRTDHLLSILATVRVNDFPRSIALLDDDEIIHHLRPGDYNFITPPDQLISLVTLSSSGARVTLHGAQYPADNLLLPPGTRGISNRCHEGALTVSVRDNDVFLILNDRVAG